MEEVGKERRNGNGRPRRKTQILASSLFSFSRLSRLPRLYRLSCLYLSVNTDGTRGRIGRGVWGEKGESASEEHAKSEEWKRSGKREGTETDARGERLKISWRLLSSLFSLLSRLPRHPRLYRLSCLYLSVNTDETRGRLGRGGERE